VPMRHVLPDPEGDQTRGIDDVILSVRRLRYRW
jgi:hypothetical protein